MKLLVPTLIIYLYTAFLYAFSGSLSVMSHPLYFYVYAFLQLAFGWFLGRFGMKKSGLIVVFIATVGAFTAPVSLELSTGVLGLGLSFAFILLLYVTKERAPRKFLGMLIGAFGVMGLLSGFLGFMVEPMELEQKNFIEITLGVLGVLFFLFLFGSKELPGRGELHFREGSAILRKKKLWLLSLALFGYAFAPMEMALLEKITPVSRPEALTIYGMTLVGWVIGSLFLGFISDQMHSRKQPALLMLFLAFCATFLLLYFKEEESAKWPLWLFFGFSLSGLFILYTWVLESFKSELAALSFVECLLFLGWGSLRERTPFIVILALIVMAFIAIWILREDPTTTEMSKSLRRRMRGRAKQVEKSRKIAFSDENSLFM